MLITVLIFTLWYIHNRSKLSEDVHPIHLKDKILNTNVLNVQCNIDIQTTKGQVRIHLNNTHTIVSLKALYTIGKIEKPQMFTDSHIT